MTGLPARIKAIAIAAGDGFSVVLGSDGRPYGTGANFSGQLTGDGHRERLTPMTGLPKAATVVAIAAGGGHVVVLTAAGLAYGAGNNDDGQLSGAGDKSTLTPISGLPAGVVAQKVAAGTYHTMVLGSDGVLYGTGRNEISQLTGDGGRTSLTPMTGLPPGARVRAIAGGWLHSLVLTADGVVHGTGLGLDGQLTGPVERSTLTPFVGQKIAPVQRPRIAGKPRVGRTVKVALRTWLPTPTAYRYRWKRNGRIIGGANQATYRLKAADRGKRITATVIASRPGALTGKRSTLAVRVRPRR